MIELRSVYDFSKQSPGKTINFANVRFLTDTSDGISPSTFFRHIASKPAMRARS